MADSLIQSLDSSAVDAVRPVFLQHVDELCSDQEHDRKGRLSTAMVAFSMGIASELAEIRKP
jgi:hypothetical protein